MLKILHHNRLDNEARKALLARATPQEVADVRRTVTEIIERVEQEGERAVIEYTEKFDRVKLDGLLVTKSEMDAAEAALPEPLRRAFEQAAANIEAFHSLQAAELRDRQTEVFGSLLGYKYIPLQGSGIYAPGGTALYPSSVLMGLIPAKLAGVKSPLVITPPDERGSVHPALLFCARLAGSERVLKAGGAQGVAAAAFGLAGERTPLIVGPGNRFVTAAKSILAGRALIRMDLPAGPSEVLIIADSTANPEFLAADLLSQAEHGADSPALLATDSEELARAVAEAVERGIERRPRRKEMKITSIKDYSAAIVFDSLDDAFHFANDYGAEHLEICTANPRDDFEKITSAGSVFLGHYAPVALGDYFSGTNHVLPTNGTARFYSGLGVEAFVKRITYQHPTRESLLRARDAILLMSELEGFDQEHGHSVAIRFEGE